MRSPTAGPSHATSTSTEVPSIDAAIAGDTVPRSFLRLLALEPGAPMLHTKDASHAEGWATWTLADCAARVASAAAGLAAHGLSRGERMVLMMHNRPDFHWLDAAAQFLRATPVSIYNSSSADEIAYLVGHAEAHIAIVEGAEYLERLLSRRDRLPALRHVFVVEPPPVLPPGVQPLGALYEHGVLDLAGLGAATEPDDIATLIYTSGTTGTPKAVMLSQRNVVYTVEQLRRRLAFDDFLGKRVVSYLPMAHIAERMIGHYQPMVLGFDVTCCPDTDALIEHFTHAHPQIVFGVPRMWEKVHHGVQAALASRPDDQAKFDDGVRLALQIKQAERDGTITAEQRATWDFLDAVAFAQVRQLIGLDATLCAVSGAAPIPRDVLLWFDAIGVPISEVYGLSESSGPITWSPGAANRPGLVGLPIPGCEVAIADDGEVLCRGGNVFVGYLRQPAQTATALVDGWLHTGDIGELDADGYLRIVDRKKELIITSGGKNVSPANLEAALKTVPLVGQAAAIGDGRKFLSAILALDPDAARLWATTHGRPDASPSELATDRDVVAEVQAGVDRVNAQFAHAEQIKRFTLVGEEWSADSDVLTPTSKLKRRGINARYAAQIEAMYATDG